MTQFKENKIYTIESNTWKIKFKITEIKRDHAYTPTFIEDIAKVELVDIKTKCKNEMPKNLQSFLKTWFDYGYCNHHEIRKGITTEYICLHDPFQNFIDPWCLLAEGN